MATATGTTRTAPVRHRTESRLLPRTTGALSGLLIIVLGVWGGLIPFIGPYFHYAFGGYQTWHYTTQRLWLDILPGAVAVIGGFMLLTSATRSGGLLGGWLAAAAGAWFAVGPPVSLLWHHTIYAIGTPAGGHFRQMLEWVGFFYGLGVAIVGLAAFAMGRYFSRPRVLEEPAVVAADAAAARRDEPVTRAAVADAPAERAAYRDAPTERAAVADAPATEVRDVPASEARVADAPATEARAADVPASEARPADAATGARAADAPVERTRAVDGPSTTVPAETAGPAETTGPGATTTGPDTTTGPATSTTRRRSGGLLARFRR